MKMMERITNDEKLSNALPFFDQMRVNFNKMVPLIPNMMNIMRILGLKIFYRKLKMNSMSIRMGHVEYIMTQKALASKV